MNSPEHRANILETRYTEVGVGLVFSAPEPVDGRAVTYTTFGGPEGAQSEC